MNASGGDLSRRALVALAIEEFKSGRITKPQLGRLLGFGTSYWLDGFLKSHEVYEGCLQIPLTIYTEIHYRNVVSPLDNPANRAQNFDQPRGKVSAVLAQLWDSEPLKRVEGIHILCASAIVRMYRRRIL